MATQGRDQRELQPETECLFIMWLAMQRTMQRQYSEHLKVRTRSGLGAAKPITELQAPHGWEVNGRVAAGRGLSAQARAAPHAEGRSEHSGLRESLVTHPFQEIRYQGRYRSLIKPANAELRKRICRTSHPMREGELASTADCSLRRGTVGKCPPRRSRLPWFSAVNFCSRAAGGRASRA